MCHKLSNESDDITLHPWLSPTRLGGPVYLLHAERNGTALLPPCIAHISQDIIGVGGSRSNYRYSTAVSIESSNFLCFCSTTTSIGDLTHSSIAFHSKKMTLVCPKESFDAPFLMSAAITAAMRPHQPPQYRGDLHFHPSEIALESFNMLSELQRVDL